MGLELGAYRFIGSSDTMSGTNCVNQFHPLLKYTISVFGNNHSDGTLPDGFKRKEEIFPTSYCSEQKVDVQNE